MSRSNGIEAHDIKRKEIDAGHLTIVNVHEQGALGPELGRLRAEPLQVPRVRDPRAALIQEVAHMHMAERPIVQSGAHEVIHGAGAVGRIVGVRTCIAVEHADLEAFRSVPPKAEREIVPGLAPRVADPVNQRQRLAITLYRNGHDRPWAKHRDAVGPLPYRRPPVLDRVVIPVHHEARYARLREPVESIPEGQLRPDASFRAIIDVTGNHDERDGVFQRRLDQVVERPCRCISEGGDEAGIDTTHPRERRVQVEIGGVEEPEAHRISSRGKRLCLP